MTDNQPNKSNGMSQAARLAVVVVVAAVAFGGAFLLLGGGSSDDRAGEAPAGGGEGTSCTAADAPDAPDATGSPYQVMVTTEPNPPTPQGSTFRIEVKRDGQAVTGASVCVTADMTEMQMDAVGGQAREAEPGRFELAVDFGMRGPWTGSVVVSEAGQEPVSVPLSFDVQ